MKILPGDRVTIRKGITVRSTYPTRTKWEARRTYKVTVHHLLSSVRVAVGHRNFDAEGNSIYESVYPVSGDDQERIIEAYGTDDLEELRGQMTESTRYGRPDGTSYTSLMLDIEPAMVVWAGTGGYWREVPVGEIPEAR